MATKLSRFLCIASVAGMLIDAGETPPKTTAGDRRVPVVTVPVQHRSFEERLVLQGNIEARTTAMVPARVSGTLIELLVDEGDKTTAGETVLFRTDDVNLRNALQAARLELEVAKCGVNEKMASVDREKANLDRRHKDYERQKRLFETEKIGTLERVEETESEYRQALALVRYTESLVALGEARRRQAETAVQIAEKNLSDATVVAPISGVISNRFQEVGDMGSPNQPVFRIVDLDSLEVSAYLPARHYATIVPGETDMIVRIGDLEPIHIAIFYKAPTIDPQMRVFEAKARLPLTCRGIAPGAMAQITVVLRREQGLGVPRESLTRRGDKNVLFRLDQDRVRETTVQTGLETDGWVQVMSDNLTEGVAVVTLGQFLLNDGSRVDVRTQANDETPRKEN